MQIKTCKWNNASSKCFYGPFFNWPFKFFSCVKFDVNSLQIFFTWKSEKRKFRSKLINSECNLFKGFLGIKRRTSLYIPFLDFFSLKNICSTEGGCYNSRGSRWVGEWSAPQQSQSWAGDSFGYSSGFAGSPHNFPGLCWFASLYGPFISQELCS